MRIDHPARLANFVLQSKRPSRTLLKSAFSADDDVFGEWQLLKALIGINRLTVGLSVIPDNNAQIHIATLLRRFTRDLRSKKIDSLWLNALLKQIDSFS